uniref:Uncharacterized protein n=1 Tax=Rhizophora mucronata TaxID=61149 RepID=A0A2P2PZ66_RHIMU
MYVRLRFVQVTLSSAQRHVLNLDSFRK